MRVLFWTYPAAFQAPGGGETILLKTRQYLQAAGARVDVFDQWTTKLRDYPLVHCFHSVYPEFWETVRQAGSRLVVTPTHWPTTDWKVRSWRWLKRRGRQLAGLGGRSKDVAYFYSLADAILPSSQTEAALLHRYCGVPLDTMTVVRNGVDPRFVDARADAFVERYGLSNFALCVGRITPNKNQLAIIRALKGYEKPLVFIGAPDPDASDYFEQCRREAGPNVHFLGWIEHDSPLLPAAFAAARVFLMPSLVDIAPLAALEAVAAGCRLVVTSVGSAREYYGDGAFYADPRSEAEIRDKTLAAFTQERRSTAEGFAVPTWEDVARQLLGVYERVLCRASARRPV
jgi:glycosyltransferase involved in cell wall biosynthesis